MTDPEGAPLLTLTIHRDRSNKLSGLSVSASPFFRRVLAAAVDLGFKENAATPGYLAADPTLHAAVSPETARMMQPPPGNPGDVEFVPWSEFFRTHGILPPQAVEMIRTRLPDALKPDDQERATWPARGTPEELLTAARKLQALDGTRGLAAQDVLRNVMTGKRKKGSQS